MEKQPIIAIIVDDMFFAAKIRSAAELAGRRIQSIKSTEQLQSLAPVPELIIIDLNSTRVDPIPAIQFIKASTDLQSALVVAFVSHVQTDLIREAQAAGCDYVLPRSAFTQRLQEIVSGQLKSNSQATPDAGGHLN